MNTRPPREWTSELTDAGFTMEERRPFDIRLDRTQAGPALSGYAQTCLAKLRSHAAADLDTDDLSVRTSRTTWIARRS